MNNKLRKRVEYERVAQLTLTARKKVLDALVKDLRKEVSKLQGLLVERRKERAVAATLKRMILTKVHPTMSRTPVSLIPFRLRRKREGGEPDRSGSLSSVVEVVEGKRSKVDEEAGPQVDPEREQGKGPVVGLKVGGVVWLVGVEGVADELGGMGFVICEGSRWLVDDAESGRRIKEGKTSSTVVALVRGE